jgi:excisionase family DNA binding protein
MAHATSSAPPLEPLAVSVAAATRLAGVGRTSIYEAIGTGELASCKLGTRRLILVDDLRAWLARQRHATGPGEAPPAPRRLPPASTRKGGRARTEASR